MKFLMFIVCGTTFLLSQREEMSYPLTAIDPKNTRDYPAGRGEHQLIVYTPAYGKKTTGTNQWGVEATVKENIVIKVGENNSQIKKGEYILSGHGRARIFLQRNVKVGAKIVLSDSSVSVVFDAESFRIYASMRKTELRAKYEKIRSQFSDAEKELLRLAIDSLNFLADRKYTSADSLLDSTSYENGMRALDDVEYRITSSPIVEGRGVWHRPTEKNREEIASFVKKISDAGLNMIFLETIWRGETIYPGFITQQKKEFVGFDPLRAFIDEGKKHGIEIHSWIHTFYVGYHGVGGDTSLGPILTAHPEWQLIKRNGEKISKAEPGYIFVNPANPEVQNYIASLIKEVCINYPDVAGIQLDYVRYPINVPLEESSDYSQLSRNEFQKIYGIDPMEINPTEHPEQWETWRKWREQVITNFVKKIRWENPEILLSADIFPDIEDAQKIKMQNWGDWAANGYVNFLVPMAYTTNTEWIAESITKMRSIIGETFPLYVGLAPYLNLSSSLLLQQIELSREIGASGVILFNSSQISDEQLRLFRIGPFRTKAKTPTLIKKNKE